MGNKIIHTSTHVPERLYKSFKKIVGLNGTTIKDVLHEMVSAYVDANKELLKVEKQIIA